MLRVDSGQKPESDEELPSALRGALSAPRSRSHFVLDVLEPGGESDAVGFDDDCIDLILDKEEEEVAGFESDCINLETDNEEDKYNDMDDLDNIENEIRNYRVADKDIEDLDELFDGIVPLAEFCRNELQAIDTNDFRRKQYFRGTERLIASTENQWRL